MDGDEEQPALGEPGLLSAIYISSDLDLEFSPNGTLAFWDKNANCCRRLQAQAPWRDPLMG